MHDPLRELQMRLCAHIPIRAKPISSSARYTEDKHTHKIHINIDIHNHINCYHNCLSSYSIQLQTNENLEENTHNRYTLIDTHSHEITKHIHIHIRIHIHNHISLLPQTFLYPYSTQPNSKQPRNNLQTYKKMPITDGTPSVIIVLNGCSYT